MTRKYEYVASSSTRWDYIKYDMRGTIWPKIYADKYIEKMR